MTDKILIMSNCGSAEEAERLARRMVERKLAACVTIGSPVTSVYRWHGAVETNQEWTLSIKSRRDLFAALRDELVKAHSYEVPEVIAVPIVDGAESYLRWMDHELKPLD